MMTPGWALRVILERGKKKKKIYAEMRADIIDI